jgi:beta-galactosidase
VTNSPPLSDRALASYARWLTRQYDASTLRRRYPFDLADPSARAVAIRSPKDGYAPQLLADLGRFMRRRTALYVGLLRRWMRESGAKRTPLFINIHGSGGGRALTFPIGISQLYEASTKTRVWPGSDMYLGNLTLDNFQDLHLCNAMMKAAGKPDQPGCALEFEVGDGNYGGNFGNRIDPSAADLKLRLSLAQGVRLFNYYLFAGGTNGPLRPAPNDGDDRIGTTGERHGIAAPVSPEGKPGYTYPRLARVTRTVRAVADKLARMEEQHDPVAVGFIPDYFMTEHHPPGSASVQRIVRNLESRRAGGSWEIMARAMLLNGYRFGAADIQNRPLDPRATPVLALGSASYMAPAVQRRLVDYLGAGGGLLLYGDVPRYDMEGRPCRILADALGVKRIADRTPASDRYLSVLATAADGWAPRPEVPTRRAQALSVPRATPLLQLHGGKEVCGFEARVGKGRAVVIATDYPCDLSFFRTALRRLGAKAGLEHGCADHGVVMTSTANPEGERFLHLINLDGFAKTLHLAENGKPLFVKPLALQPRDGVMLPLGVTLGGVTIRRSTAEITGVGKRSLELRLTQDRDVIELQTARELLPGRDYTVERRGDAIIVTSRKQARVDDRLVLRFR